ncbi:MULTISPECIES: transferrin-binding protein-like solute binding protein [unclassified Yoonia]|uniref:transferrin-binding protein-like solute binding protein n=1 Tax=unclassified Yoonia TaxID=2629118 RepID=UPI002AFEDB3E|nr:MULTISPECIES: transferrin-binding protein-like solute binding protein [unclassified Yoonia]
MNALKIAFALVSVAALAACGGGGGGIGGGGPVLLQPAPAGSFNAFVNDETLFLNEYYSNTLQPIRTQAMPTGGTAVYTGTAAFGNGRSTSSTNGVISRSLPDMTGATTLNANFGTARLNGTITNFRSADNTALPGTITLGNATINGNRIVQSSSVTGTVPLPGGQGNITFGQFNGGFVGQNAAGFDGTLVVFANRSSGGQTLNAVITADQ